MARPNRKPSKHVAQSKSADRSFTSRGVAVEISESKKKVNLKLDGVPIPVSIIDGAYHCQLANQFKAFGSVDEIVDQLIATEGRLWTLHGKIRGAPGHHHTSDSSGHDSGAGAGGHQHGTGGNQ